MEQKFLIDGMSCVMCQSAVEKSIAQLNGVESVNVNLLTNTADVVYKSEAVTNDVLTAIKDAGYEGHLMSLDKTIVLKCDGDISSVPLQSVKSIKQKDGLWYIEFAPGNIKTYQILQQLSPYHPQLIQETDSSQIDGHQKRILEQRNKGIIMLLLSLVVMYIAMAEMFNVWIFDAISQKHNPQMNVTLQLILSTVGLFFSSKILRSGIINLRNKTPNMDSLVTMGVFSAYIYSIYHAILIYGGQVHHVHHLYFESSVMILAFILIGKYFEARSIQQTTAAVQTLLNLRPKKALLFNNDVEIEIDSDEIAVQDLLLVKPGQSIPVDGVIVQGNTSINESMISGESMPVDKQVGDEVIMGTVNYNGTIIMKATAILNETKLAKMVDLVNQAQSKKAPISKLVDRISAIFVPTVVILAIISFIGWMIVSKHFEKSFLHFVSVLVIACPCALGLATPTAIMVATGKGASEGILIKSAEILEKSAKIDIVVFDKTGTLTLGQPNVVAYQSDDTNFFKKLASVESFSSHPLAKAMVSNYQGDLVGCDEFTLVEGQGVSGKINEHLIRIGNRKMHESLSIDEEFYHLHSNLGHTVLIVSEDDHYLGMVAIADEIKPDSKQLVSRLLKDNYRVVMLTGDQKQTAQAIADKLGITEVIAEVLPQEKGDWVEKFMEQGQVMMVGDGVNDALALVSADLGVAIGSGVDVAIDSADVVLMHENLMDIHKTLRLSKATMKNIKENLFWAFIYNCVGLLAAMGVFAIFGGPTLNPMMASAAMGFSSISVVLNALRLKRFK